MSHLGACSWPHQLCHGFQMAARNGMIELVDWWILSPHLYLHSFSLSGGLVYATITSRILRLMEKYGQPLTFLGKSGHMPSYKLVICQSYSAAPSLLLRVQQVHVGHFQQTQQTQQTVPALLSPASALPSRSCWRSMTQQSLMQERADQGAVAAAAALRNHFDTRMVIEVILRPWEHLFTIRLARQQLQLGSGQRSSPPASIMIHHTLSWRCLIKQQ